MMLSLRLARPKMEEEKLSSFRLSLISLISAGNAPKEINRILKNVLTFVQGLEPISVASLGAAGSRL